MYQPPLGINQEMYMWTDFKYGADDPLLWPQFYMHSDPWLCCIRKRPRDSLDPFQPLYEPITRSNFDTSGSPSAGQSTRKTTCMLATNIPPSTTADPELIGAFTMDLLPNPFALVAGEVCANPPLPEPEPEPVDLNMQKAITKSKKPNQSSQREVFLSVIVDPLLPPAIPLWKAVVESTNSDRSRCYPEARMAEANGYIFPCPDIFAGVQNEQKALELIKAWLSWPIAHQSCSSNASLSRTVPTKAGKRRDQAIDFLEGCDGELQIDANFKVGPTVWRGIELEMLTDDHRWEIVWELAEINFRFELFAVGCMSGNKQWKPRATPTLSALWPYHSLSCPDLVQQKKTSYTEVEFNKMERCTIHFYVDSFFCFFGHVPVIPRQLSHFPQTSFIPETHKEVYMERLGLVFDLAQFDGH
ncbi:hypothetical protein IW261DRAFT_1420968 [Armillaria novae-zelandiae]|uniref:Uncharacterized protein n=1 Tax=Armillaria novae-zelandiae TaxID=153914 RepID=A0AA39P449_9AGAR|nr:hypothetical protein IW261DRAFT_1420968 [Armillaria novae-zelandiae]